MLSPKFTVLGSEANAGKAASLLLHFDGANNSTTFKDSSPRALPVTANGGAVISTAQSKFGGASGVFNGSNAQLTIPHSSDLDLGTGDFTVEAWVFLNSNTSSTFFATGSNNGWFFGQSGGEGPPGGVGFGRKGLAWDVIDQSAGRLPTGQWIHLAATRNGATLRTFVNGALTASATTSASFDVDGSTLYIGSHGNFMFFNGYIDEFRIVKGLAIYTGPFIPPTAPLSPYAKPKPIEAQASLLLHFDGSDDSTVFTDSSVNALTVTANGAAQISTERSNFNGSSGYMGAPGDSLSLSAVSLPIAADEDFTMEAWIYLPTEVNFVELFGMNSKNYFIVEPTVIYFNGDYDPQIVAYYTFPTDVWQHVAVTRANNTLRVFVDGQIVHTASESKTYFTQSPTLTIGRQNDGGPSASSYIDDLRIVKGLAVYTGPFIPPTAPLQPIAEPYPVARPASLLLPFNTNFADTSANALTPTVLGDSARVYVDSTTSKFGGGALRTESDNSSLYGALRYQHADLAFGTGDFTVEMWFYVPTATGNQTAILWDSNSIDCAGDGIMLLIGDPPGTIGFRYVGCSGPVYDRTPITPDTWHHVAVSRQNGVLKTFLNGVEFGVRPPLVNLTNNTATVGGIADLGPSWAFFDGYIDHVRVVKGLAVYTGPFNPPTDPLQVIATPKAIEAQASLLLHMDGSNGSTSFTDSSSNALAVTANGDAQISTAQSKFGGASAYFDGSGDYLTVPSAAPLELGAGDFTIEMWYYYISGNTNPYPALISKGQENSTDPDAWTLEFTGSSLGTVFWTASNGPGGGTPPQNEWVHVAVTRDGAVLRLFVNGTLSGTYGPFTETIAANPNGQLVIGCGWYDLASRFFHGYIDEVRIVKGLAVYTSNFTPPTGPLSATISTVSSPPQYGTFLYAECRNNDFVGVYANGLGGYYTEIISAGSCA